MENLDDNYKEYLQKVYHENVKNKIKSSGIPPEFLDYSLTGKEGTKFYNVATLRGKVNPSKENALQTTRQYILNIHKNRESGKGIYLYGLPNQKLGMSLLGTLILRAAIEYGYTAMFESFPTFCENLDWDGDAEVRERYHNVDFLMLDSVSPKCLRTSKVCNGFADVVLERRKENKPTIFSAYVDPRVLSTQYSESLISYFDEFIISCEIIHEQDNRADITYNIDALVAFLKQKRNDKPNYTAAELDFLLQVFQQEYRYLS